MLLKLTFLHLFKSPEGTSNLQIIFPHNETKLFNEIPGHIFELKYHKQFSTAIGASQSDAK